MGSTNKRGIASIVSTYVSHLKRSILNSKASFPFEWSCQIVMVTYMTTRRKVSRANSSGSIATFQIRNYTGTRHSAAQSWSCKFKQATQFSLPCGIVPRSLIDAIKKWYNTINAQVRWWWAIRTSKKVKKEVACGLCLSDLGNKSIR